jgi:hypothetical protein
MGRIELLGARAPECSIETILAKREFSGIFGNAREPSPRPRSKMFHPVSMRRVVETIVPIDIFGHFGLGNACMSKKPPRSLYACTPPIVGGISSFTAKREVSCISGRAESWVENASPGATALC